MWHHIDAERSAEKRAEQGQWSKPENASKTIVWLYADLYTDMKGQRSCNTQTEHIDKAGCLLGTCFCYFQVAECLW